MTSEKISSLPRKASRGPPEPAPTMLFACPRCEEEILLQVTGDLQERAACPRCGFSGRGAAPAPRAALRACWLCGEEDFYVQKDFNRRLGLAIAASSFAAVFLVMLLVGHRAGIYLLFVLALADWLAYRKLAEVTVCYLCQSVYRGFPLNPAHRGFDLAREERAKSHRQEWLAAAGER